MQNIHEILEKYWGFKSFRPLQEDIINSVMNGNDTLALLPTGGGKSICFQVPALAIDGICVVVSPLIALMKDQVENLSSKGIKAISITSAMNRREIDIALDNCVHGNIKFLYLSPERLETEIVKVRLQKMNISLIAIDEAHCISQWGYDFRPSYLKIAELKQLLPSIPFLALTATATKEVVKDIQQKLLFVKPNVFQQSYERKNVSYVVLTEEDKLVRLIKIATNVNGTGIVYVRNRRKTQDIANYLNSNKISADFYHAGLNTNLRTTKQDNWIKNKTRIMVCTNAFGMGIDKSDVRFVVHLDLPDSLEAYFQEAGRCGRDGRKAYAVLLFNPNDKLELQTNLQTNFPSLDEIKQTYQALANYYQLGTGGGMGSTFDFNITELCKTYNLQSITVFNCLKFIDREGYISLTDAMFQSSKLKIEFNKEELYKFQIANKEHDAFIKLLLRSYSGLFDNFIKINEYDLAKKANTKHEIIIKHLNYLQQIKVINYIPQTELPQITYIQPRVNTTDLIFSKENFQLLKERAIIRMEAVIEYTETKNLCRSQVLLAYFGEMETQRCNQCDVCLEENRKILHTEDFENISTQIKELLILHPLSLKALVDKVTETNDDKILHTIQVMIDTKQITHNTEGKITLTN